MARWVAMMVLATAAPGLRAAVVGEIRQVGFPGSVGDMFGRDRGSLIRHGKWVPIRVDLTVPPAGDHFNGLLRIEQEDRDGDQVVSESSITLTAGAESRPVWLYFQPKLGTYRQMDFRIRLVEVNDDGEERAASFFTSEGMEQKFLSPPSQTMPVSSEDGIILDISLGGGVMAVLVELTQTRAEDDRLRLKRQFHAAHIGATDLPDSWLGLEMVDFIIWDDADPTALEDAPRQLGALIDWVRQGGCLVLAAAQTWDELAQSALGPLLPVDAGPVIRDVTYPGLSELAGVSGGWPALADLVAYRSVRPRPRAHPLPGDARGDTIFFEHQEGHGRVVVIPASLRELLRAERFPDGFGREEALATLLGLRRTNEDPRQAFSSSERQLFPQLRGFIDFRGATSVRMLIGVLFVVAYIFVATFGSWQWLRGRGWLKHSWSAFAVVAAVASVITIAGVGWVQGIRTRVQQVAIVDAEAGSTSARAYILFGLKTPTHQELDIWLPKDSSLQSRPGDEETSCWLRAVPGAEEGTDAGYAAPGRYQIQPRWATMSGVPVRATLKQLEGHWSGSLRGQLRASIRTETRAYMDPESEVLRRFTELTSDSWIRNDLGVDLADSYVLHAMKRWPGYERGVSRRDDDIFIRRLGPIKNGERIDDLKAKLYQNSDGSQLDVDTRGGLLRPALHNLAGWHLKLSGRAPFLSALNSGPASEVTDDLTQSLLMLTTLDEYAAAYMPESGGAEIKTDPMRGGHGRQLDRSSLLTPETVLFVGFADAPGPALLKIRAAGDDDNAWAVLRPRNRAADQQTVYRITIPITQQNALAAQAGGS